MRSILIPVLFIAAIGCAKGTSIVDLTITASGSISGADRLTITATDTTRHAMSSPAVVQLSGVVPASQTLPLRFPSTVQGPVLIQAVVSGKGQTLAMGSTTVVVSPSKTVTASIALQSSTMQPQPGTDMGGTNGPPPDPALSTVTVDRATGVVANGADAATITVTLRDSTGAALSGVAVQITPSGSGSASVTTPAPTDTSGVTTASLTSTVVQTVTISASASGVTLSQQPTVEFIAGPPAQLSFTVQPQKSYVGHVMPAVSVSIVDANGHAITSATNTITVGLAPNGSSASVTGIPSVAAVGGQATFDVLAVTAAGSGLTMSATSPGLTSGTSQPFNAVAYPWQLVTSLGGGTVGIGSYSAASGALPARIYSTSGSLLYTSTDLGMTWTEADLGLPAAPFVVADPTNPNTAYAYLNLDSNFAYKTTNGGAGWEPLPGPAGFWADQIAVNPANSSILYARAQSNTPPAYYIYKSTNGGLQWTQLNFPYIASYLAIDPVTPSTIYVAAYQQNPKQNLGVYKSIDAGASWQPINTGLAEMTINTLYATPAALFAIGQQSVYRTTNAGQSWTNLNIASNQSCPITYATSNPMIVYRGICSDGIHVSTDGGATFPTTHTPTGASVGGPLLNGPGGANDLFAGTSSPGGLARSNNGGATFTPLGNNGVAQLSLTTVAADPMKQYASYVIVGALNGKTYYSADSGATWNASTMDPNDTGTPSAVAFDPNNASVAYLCATGFHVSNDYGATWGVSPSATVVCGSSTHFAFGNGIFVSSSAGVFHSTNQGGSWTSLNAGGAGSAIAASGNGGTVFALIDGKVKAYNGATWSAALLNDPNQNALEFNDQAAAAASQVVVGEVIVPAVSSTGGFRYSTNTGTTWSAVSQPSASINDIIYEPNVYTTLYAVGMDLGGYRPAFFLSNDNGQTWMTTPIQPSCTQFYNNCGISKVSANYNGTAIFAAGGGLYKSTTGGL